MKRRIAITTLLAFIALIGLAFAAEWQAARALAADPANERVTSWLAMSTPHRDLIYWHRPNTTTTDPYGNMIRINRLGLRGPDVATPKPPNTLRLLTLGESGAFGATVAETETFTARTAALLQPHVKTRLVEPLNAGLGTSTSFQGATFLDTHITSLAPDLVLVHYLMSDQQTPTPRGNIVQSTMRRAIFGFGFGNTDRDVTTLRQRLGPLLPLLDGSALAMWLRARAASTYEHNADVPPDGKHRVPQHDRLINLRRIVAIAHNANARVVFLIPATRSFNRAINGPAYGQDLREVALSTQSLLVDLDEAIDLHVRARNAEDPRAGRDRLYTPEGHLRAEGHEVAAQAIVNTLVSQWLPPAL